MTAPISSANRFTGLSPHLETLTWAATWNRFAKQRASKLETYFVRRDEQEVRVDLSFDLIEGEGKVPYLFVVATETGDRIESQEALGSSQSIQNAIMESSLDSIILIDVNASILFINRTVPELTPDEVIGTCVLDYVAEEFHPVMKGCFQRVLETGKPDSYQVEYKLSDGLVTEWETRVAPVFAGAQVTALTLIARDVSDYRRTLDALKSSERTIARAQQIAKIGSWEFDVVSGSTKGTPEAYRLMGLDEAAASPTLFEFLEEIVHPEDRRTLADALESAVRTGEAPAAEFRIRRQTDDEIRYMRVEAEVLRDDSDASHRIIGTFQDITSQKESQLALREMESQLAHVARLSTMGEMVAGIAHEINQPLSAIANYALACRNALDRSEPSFDVPVDDWLEQINEQAVRCGDIIRRLRGFVKNEESERQWLDVNQVVRDSVALVGSHAGQHLQVFQCELGSAKALSMANRVQLQQVLVNLLRNAADATRGVDDAKIVVRVLEAGERISISVQDNGSGVGHEAASRLFDAFFTTKEDGMGMGLAISKSIVESHGGTLRMKTGDGPGAEFVVDLPGAKSIPASTQNAG